MGGGVTITTTITNHRMTAVTVVVTADATVIVAMRIAVYSTRCATRCGATLDRYTLM